MKTPTRLILAGSILAALHVHAAPIYWTGDNGSNFDTGTANSNWSTDAAGTTDYAQVVQTGDALNFAATGVLAGVLTSINNNQAGLSIGSLTFTSNLAGPVTIGGNAFTLTGGLTNNNTTASRNVTIGNAITVSGTQTWAAANANAITTLGGNLDGTGTISINGVASNGGTQLPTVRLTGANSSYSGTIGFITTTSGGVLLGSATAQTGGLIDMATINANANLWLTGGGGSGTYTFGITNAASTVGTTTGARVAFRGAGTSGIYLTGGDVTWDPGSGGNYTWANGSSATVDINGSNDTTPRMLFFGNSTGNLTLAHTAAGTTFTMRNGGGGNNPALVTMQFALADDATGGRTFASGTNLMILTRPAVNNGATKSIVSITAGALAVTNMNQIFGGNLNLSGGVILLDNVSWTNFTTNRSSGIGAGINQWQITNATGGFAARGADLTIDATGTTSTFDRDFALGAAALGTDGSLYGNRSVIVDVDTALSVQRTIRLAQAGPGLINVAGSAVMRFSGDLSGAGSLSVVGSSRDGSAQGRIGELVLAGANTWTGNPFIEVESIGINAGQGGLTVGNNATNNDGGDAFVRFDGDASLPAGATGTAYLTGNRRNGSDFQYGYLLTGGATVQSYDLNTGYKIVLGTGNNASPRHGAVGSAGGIARLQSSDIAINQFGGTAATGTASLGLFVRDGSLTLGASGAAVRLQPTFSADATNAGATGAATALSDRTGLTTLVKRGEGTLILGNIAYTDVAGGTLATPNFTWQIGRATTLNNGATSYSDGAVRTLADGDPAADNSNSLKNFPVLLRGGVLEINANGASPRVFTRTLAATPTAGQINMGSGGGGGFAAFGGPVQIDLNTAGTRDNLIWSSTGGFLSVSESLILGSTTADAKVEWFDNLNLATNNTAITREIRVIDNASSPADRAEITGNVTQSGGTGQRGLTKTGTGTLVLSGAANDYDGATTISAGALLVNGTVPAGDAGLDTVTGSISGTLGGTGSIARPVVINGTLSPGDPLVASGIESLNVGLSTGSGLDFKGGGTFALDLGATTGDVVNVAGTAALSGSGNIALSIALTAQPVAFTPFVIINNDSSDAFGFGANLFSFAGTPLADGAFFTVTGAFTQQFQIDYTYDGGGDTFTNDVALIAVPEPSAAVALLGGLGLLLGLRRRRA